VAVGGASRLTTAHRRHRPGPHGGGDGHALRPHRHGDRRAVDLQELADAGLFFK